MKRLRNPILALALTSVLVISCSDGSPNAVPDPVDLTSLTLARCVPDTAGTATATIGRDGGTIRIGRNTLVVPRRSLDDNVAITMTVSADSTASATFLPEGLHFKNSKPAVLTLSYSGCDFGADSASAAPRHSLLHDDDDDDDDNSGHGNSGHGKPPESTGIVYLGNDQSIIEFLPGTVDSASSTITSKLRHFSRYAVAW